MIKLLKFVFLFIVIWFSLHTTTILIDGLNDKIAKVDLGVVLGNKVEPGGEPSARLKSRLDRALSLYREGYLRYVLVSGGLGKEGFDEAEVMKQYLISNGVPKEVINVDRNGNNTFLTAKNTKGIMDEQGMSSVMVISQYYHITRSKLALSKAGIKQVYSAHAIMFPETRDLYSVAREFVGFYAYLLK